MSELETPNVEESEEVQLSPEEQKARSTGWVDKDEWEESGKDPNDWVDYKVFNIRGDFYSEIHSLKRQLKQYGQIVEDLKNHNQKLAKERSDELVKSLKAEKIKALEEGDGKKVAAIDDWIDEIKDQNKAAIQPTQKQDNTVNPEVQTIMQEWLNENPWYNKDPELQSEVDSIAYGMAVLEANKKQRPLDESEIKSILSKTTTKVKKLYPDKFRNPNKDRAASVTSSSVSSSHKTTSKVTLRDIPEEYRGVAKTLTSGSNPVMTLDEYYSQLKSVGGV